MSERPLEERDLTPEDKDLLTVAMTAPVMRSEIVRAVWTMIERNYFWNGKRWARTRTS